MCIIKCSAKGLGLSHGSRWHCMAWRPWVIVELVAESWVSHSGLIADTVLSFGMLKRHMLRNVKEKAASKTSLHHRPTCLCSGFSHASGECWFHNLELCSSRGVGEEEREL